MKRCQVCGIKFDPDRDGWKCERAFRGRHIPTDRPGIIYILCFGEPIYVQQSDNGHIRPTSHYVGWTGQAPIKRITQHGGIETDIAELIPGTAENERRIKEVGTCPRCGKLLAPECLGGI